MSEMVVMTREEFSARIDDAHRLGMLTQRLIDSEPPTHHQSNGVEGERPKLHLVPVDAPTAQLIEFPTNEKTASWDAAFRANPESLEDSRMTTKNTNQPSGLHAKIAEIVGAVTNIEKDGYNSQHNYHFVTEAAFLSAVREEMATRGVTVYPTVRPDTVKVHDRAQVGDKGFITTCVVGYTFTDADTGENFTAEVVTQGFDSLDKGAFKAMTGAVKYALRQTFLIPTGDDAEHETAGGSTERPEDNLQMGVLPPDTAFLATIREAAWAKPKGKDKIVAVAGVTNTNGGLDAGEKLWLEPGRPDYKQFVQHVCGGIEPPVGGSLAALVGKPFDLTVTMNGEYRNFTIAAPTPVEVPDAA